MTINNPEIQVTKRPWAQGAVGLFMLAFGVCGIYLLRTNSMYIGGQELADIILTYGLLGFVAVMGLWGLVLTVIEWNSGEAELPGFLQAYHDAWRRMTGLRWLLVILGVVALVNVLGGLAELALSRYYLGDAAKGVFQGGMRAGGLPPLYTLIWLIPQIVSGSLGHFFPDVYAKSTGAEAFLAILILALIPWANRQLRAMREEPDAAGNAGILPRLIVPIGIACAVVAVGELFGLWYMYSSLAAQIANSSGSAPTAPYMTVVAGISNILGWILQSLVLRKLNYAKVGYSFLSFILASLAVNCQFTFTLD